MQSAYRGIGRDYGQTFGALWKVCVVGDDRPAGTFRDGFFVPNREGPFAGQHFDLAVHRTWAGLRDLLEARLDRDPGYHTHRPKEVAPCR